MPTATSTPPLPIAYIPGCCGCSYSDALTRVRTSGSRKCGMPRSAVATPAQMRTSPAASPTHVCLLRLLTRTNSSNAVNNQAGVSWIASAGLHDDPRRRTEVEKKHLRRPRERRRGLPQHRFDRRKDLRRSIRRYSQIVTASASPREAVRQLNGDRLRRSCRHAPILLVPGSGSRRRAT